ncbi:MAG: dihydroorotate dehydrogenase electron transfer subunit [Clostridia bacterium]|nr:dihydroorotate dehydrogenase electron transfer subunit [Clostridia bacterium]
MQYQIIENTPIAPGVFLLDLAGDTSMVKAPGQFCQIRIPGFYLRRPISLCDWDENGMTLIYKAVGQGTDALSRMEIGGMLDILNGLGNGYDLSNAGAHPLVIGGGAGVPPLYALAKALIAQGAEPIVCLGFNKAEEVFLLDSFEDLDVPVLLATVDGSAGQKGFVTDALPEGYDSFFACGPLPMLQAVYKTCKTAGQLSLEERMACGFGACMGCTIQTRNGPKRVCKDGPVFRKEELTW